MKSFSKETINQIYTALIQQRGGWWIGWIEETPGVNCQEKSREELVETLTITLKEALARTVSFRMAK